MSTNYASTFHNKLVDINNNYTIKEQNIGFSSNHVTHKWLSFVSIHSTMSRHNQFYTTIYSCFSDIYLPLLCFTTHKKEQTSNQMQSVCLTCDWPIRQWESMWSELTHSQWEWLVLWLACNWWCIDHWTLPKALKWLRLESGFEICVKWINRITLTEYITI